MLKNKAWMKLDNAAKIYPAAKRRNWTALFRLSAELDEPVDPLILEQAQRNTVARFPFYAQRLRRGLFWFYLEQLEGTPPVQKDVANPCVRMRLKENGGFMFRVRYYDRRIAVEFFHVLTDGAGGLIFLKTLVAEYLRLKHGLQIPPCEGVADCADSPSAEEAEDAYARFARRIGASRKEEPAFFIRGTDENDELVHITTGMLSVEPLKILCHQKNVSLTEYLTAVLILVIQSIQARCIPNQRHHKPVKICVPVNLRQFYPTRTMRNFASYVNVGIEPKYGEYDFDEILTAVHHGMGAEATEKKLNAKISANINSERNRLLRFAPLFLKNAALKLTFHLVGDRLSSSSISNLGVVRLPEEMTPYVKRMDFVLGPLSKTRVVCAVLSYNGCVNINFTRKIRESAVEREFFRFLVRQGLHVKVECNRLSLTRPARSFSVKEEASCPTAFTAE